MPDVYKRQELQRAHIRQQKVAAQEQPVQEQPEQEAPQDKDTFSIYQIKGGNETRDLRFEPYDRLTATGPVSYTHLDVYKRQDFLQETAILFLGAWDIW